MKNLYKVLGIVALVAAIVFSFASCGGGGGKADPELNGTWTYDDVELKINKGNFETSISSAPYVKGTYTTTDEGKITVKATHFHGGSPLAQQTQQMGVSLDSKWYSKSDLISAVKNVLKENYSQAKDQFEAQLDVYYGSFEGHYQINGGSLSFSGYDSSNPVASQFLSPTYTKK